MVNETFKSNPSVGSKDRKHFKENEAKLARKLRFDLSKLSPTGKEVFQDFWNETVQVAQNFSEDLHGGVLAKRSLAMSERPKAIFNQTEVLFANLMNGVVNQFLKKLWKFDQDFQKNQDATQDAREKQGLRNAYEANLKRMKGIAHNGIQELASGVRSVVTVAGSIEGERVLLDTFSEIDIFNRNFREWLEKLKVPENWIEDAMQQGILDVNILKAVDDASLQMIKRIERGQELSPEAYDNLVFMLKDFFGNNRRLDEASTLGNQTRAIQEIDRRLRPVEDSGAFMVVHALSPAQRFTLGEQVVRSQLLQTPEKKAEGIRFLLNSNFLDIGQAQKLLSQIDPKMALKPEEVVVAQKTQEMVKKMRARAEAFLKKDPETNLMITHGTATNVLVYEIVGHIGIIGAVLPFLLNIGDPGEWQYILTDPFWLACVATAGLALDKVSGGDVGKGDISRKLIEITEVPHGKQESLNQQRLKEFAQLYGKNPETMEFLKKNDFALLKEIYEEAQKTEDPEKYYFNGQKWKAEKVKKLTKLDKDLTPEQAGQAAEKEMKTRYGLNENLQLDGRRLSEVEGVINQVYQDLYLKLKCNTALSIPKVFAEVDKLRGIRH